MEADLIFPESYKSDGFTNSVTSAQAAAPDPVVRELLQNSLDAAVREAHHDRAEVHFTIARRWLRELPGLRAYERAFEAAVREREAKVASNTHDQRGAISRVRKVLEQSVDEPEMSVLFCRDNGVGLDRSGLESLLTEGNSNKAKDGAGSYGLGHLTAYAASDLRYVLYAGRRWNGRRAEIAGGRAILAAHKSKTTQHAAEGFWRLPADIFTLGDSNYPTEAPPLLAEEMDRIDTSGTVVAIAGFNHFHDDDETTAFDDICRVAALNFMAAIWMGRMVVYVHDEDWRRDEVVDADSLDRLLNPHSTQQRLPTGMRGWLVGSQGYRALHTLMHGDVLDVGIDKSIKVHFRRLDPKSNERSRVQIFRDGMWIDNDAPELGSSAFNGVEPFDAVVLLHDADPDDHGEFYDLVRNSEGPEHRGLTKYRELPRRERARLREMLKQLADRLRDEAGAVKQEETYTPEGFAVFSATDLRDASPVPRLRHRPVAGDQTGTGTTSGEAEGQQESNNPGKRTRQRHTRRAPAAGRAVRLRRTIVPVAAEGGVVRRVEAEIEMSRDRHSRQDRYELRMFVESGSDETCDQPLQPQWLGMRSVESNGRVTSARGAMEVEIPADTTSLAIELQQEIPVSAVIELDVVRRRPASEGSA